MLFFSYLIFLALSLALTSVFEIQMPVGPEIVAPYATGGGLSYGRYDVPRGGGPHVRR